MRISEGTLSILSLEGDCQAQAAYDYFRSLYGESRRERFASIVFYDGVPHFVIGPLDNMAVF